MKLSRHQWIVFAAAWLGWGFDVFDAMLFNFVASNCIPTLLGLTLGSTAAREATVYWTGILSAVLLVGWAAGGVIFGWVADRYGRRVGLMLTILVYALGTTLCAFATSIEQLAYDIDAYEIKLSDEVVKAVNEIHAEFMNPGQ